MVKHIRKKIDSERTIYYRRVTEKELFPEIRKKRKEVMKAIETAIRGKDTKKLAELSKESDWTVRCLLACELPKIPQKQVAASLLKRLEKDKMPNVRYAVLLSAEKLKIKEITDNLGKKYFNITDKIIPIPPSERTNKKRKKIMQNSEKSKRVQEW